MQNNEIEELLSLFCWISVASEKQTEENTFLKMTAKHSASEVATLVMNLWAMWGYNKQVEKKFKPKCR